jgi:hypothetical protein
MENEKSSVWHHEDATNLMPGSDRFLTPAKVVVFTRLEARSDFLGRFKSMQV